MKEFKFEKREIRSFRIYKGILDLKEVFINAKKPAIFTMSDAFQPVDRADLREILKNQGLKISYVSKKVINLWTQNIEWSILRELLRGNVIKIELNNGKTTSDLDIKELKQEQLEYIMSKDIFSIRLLVENKKLYRQDKIKEYITTISEGINFKHNILNENLRTPLIASSLISNLVYLKANYNKKTIK
jgi:hypothetical protein